MAARLLRFSVSERVIHWLVAVAFAVMLLSGTQVPGGAGLSSGMFDIHVGAAVVLVAGLLAVLVLGNGRALVRTAGEVVTLDRLDREWLSGAPARLASREPAPPAGRFNAGQKVNAMLSALGLAVLYVSGIVVTFTGNVSPQNEIHSGAAVVMVVLIAGHVYMAVLNPATRHALRGITVGDVDRDWAEHHHPRWDAVSGDPADPPASG